MTISDALHRLLLDNLTTATILLNADLRLEYKETFNQVEERTENRQVVAGFQQLAELRQLVIFARRQHPQLQLAQAQAGAARDEALLAKMRADTTRYMALKDRNFVSEEKVNDTRTNEAAAQANLRASKAAVEVARLQRDYAEIRAPIAGVIGVLSSVIDNVPLVAACMGMYPVMDAAAVAASADPAYMQSFVQDGLFWHLLTYCAGVGGSLLIIGSAAGVVAMGLEKINFGWYLKRISLLALSGYLAGIAVIWLEHVLIGL